MPRPAFSLSSCAMTDNQTMEVWRSQCKEERRALAFGSPFDRRRQQMAQIDSLLLHCLRPPPSEASRHTVLPPIRGAISPPTRAREHSRARRQPFLPATALVDLGACAGEKLQPGWGTWRVPRQRPLWPACVCLVPGCSFSIYHSTRTLPLDRTGAPDPVSLSPSVSQAS